MRVRPSAGRTLVGPRACSTGSELLLRVHPDEGSRTGRVVSGSIDKDLAVEDHLARRGCFALLPLTSRSINGCHQRSDARPRHVEGDLVDDSEVVSHGARSRSGNTLEVLGAGDRRRNEAHPTE